MDDIFDISIDYNKTIKQANKLSRIAADLRGVRNDARSAIKFTESNWKGRTGESISSRLSHIESKSLSIAERLEQVSATMKRVANDIMQADMDSIARIEKF